MSDTEQQLRDIEAIIAREIDTSRKELETKGHLSPRFLFLSLNAEGILEMHVVLMPEMEGTLPGHGRDAFAEMLRHLAGELDALAYFSIMEVWAIAGTKDRPPRSRHLDWAHDPNARELVVAILETGVGTTIAHMPILRKPGRPPTFAPGALWEKQQRVEGRWAGVLPQKSSQS